MTNIQAAVGCAQLERLEEFLQRKRYVREFYKRELSDVKGISFFPAPKNQESSCWFSGIVFENGGLEKIREFCAKLKDAGIEARSFWKPVHLQKPYADAYKADSLKVTENLWDRIVTLPCSTNITDEDLNCVVKAIRSLL